MTYSEKSAADISVGPSGSGYLFPLMGSLVLTLIWGAYTVWVSLEIISQRP